jgi:hypothetical protein
MGLRFHSDLPDPTSPLSLSKLFRPKESSEKTETRAGGIQFLAAKLRVGDETGVVLG